MRNDHCKTTYRYEIETSYLPREIPGHWKGTRWAFLTDKKTGARGVVYRRSFTPRGPTAAVANCLRAGVYHPPPGDTWGDESIPGEMRIYAQRVWRIFASNMKYLLHEQTEYPFPGWSLDLAAVVAAAVAGVEKGYDLDDPFANTSIGFNPAEKEI